MFIASLLLAFSTILLCNATIDTQIISRVDNTQEILSVILGIAIVLLLTAGIAIKNIMYISILQRTREFAQLRTVGATYRQIKAVIHNERKQLSWKYILGGLLLGFLFNCVLPLKLYLVPVWPAHCFPVLLYGSLFFGHSVHRQNWLRLYPLWRH